MKVDTIQGCPFRDEPCVIGDLGGSIQGSEMAMCLESFKKLFKRDCVDNGQAGRAVSKADSQFSSAALTLASSWVDKQPGLHKEFILGRPKEGSISTGLAGRLLPHWSGATAHFETCVHEAHTLGSLRVSAGGPKRVVVTDFLQRGRLIR